MRESASTRSERRAGEQANDLFGKLSAVDTFHPTVQVPRESPIDTTLESKWHVGSFRDNVFAGGKLSKYPKKRYQLRAELGKC